MGKDKRNNDSYTVQCKNCNEYKEETSNKLHALRGMELEIKQKQKNHTKDVFL